MYRNLCITKKVRLQRQQLQHIAGQVEVRTYHGHWGYRETLYPEGEAGEGGCHPRGVSLVRHHKIIFDKDRSRRHCLGRSFCCF